MWLRDMKDFCARAKDYVSDDDPQKLSECSRGVEALTWTSAAGISRRDQLSVPETALAMTASACYGTAAPPFFARGSCFTVVE
jgi:hypothetical protein